jgi:hypothetical protein
LSCSERHVLRNIPRPDAAQSKLPRSGSRVTPPSRLLPDYRALNPTISDEITGRLAKECCSMPRKLTSAERRLTSAERRKKRFIDGIKNEIDKLNTIRSVKQRREAASDLIDYINLHYIDVLTL